MSKTIIGMVACGAAALFGPAAAADTVSFTLGNPVQSVTTNGGILSFNATVAAPTSNSGTEYLNADNRNIYSSTVFDFDDSGFLFDFPLSLDPGESYTGTFFTLDIPAGTKAQSFTGTLDLLGGPSPDSFDRLGSANFSVNINAVAAAAPEPATWGMMILGFGIVGGALRRRRPVTTRVSYAV